MSKEGIRVHNNTLFVDTYYEIIKEEGKRCNEHFRSFFKAQCMSANEEFTDTITSEHRK